MHEMQVRYRAQIEEITDACVRLGELGYVASHGGNLSYRVDENAILITPTKVSKRKVSFDDIVIIDLNGKVLFAAKNRKPTGESPFHLRILKKRPDVNAVIHAHPPILTGFSIGNPEALTRPYLPEPIFEVGPVLPVEYAEPLSEELALAFERVLDKGDAFLMKNHGFLMCGREGVARTQEMVEMMENTAYSLFVAISTGEAREISEKDLEDLDRTVKTRELKFPGAPGVVKGLKEMY